MHLDYQRLSLSTTQSLQRYTRPFTRLLTIPMVAAVLVILSLLLFGLAPAGARPAGWTQLSPPPDFLRYPWSGGSWITLTNGP